MEKMIRMAFAEAMETIGAFGLMNRDGELFWALSNNRLVKFVVTIEGSGCRRRRIITCDDLYLGNLPY